jgi:ADP-ribose pyrophosphatase YjhB (NUDIX family)
MLKNIYNNKIRPIAISIIRNKDKMLVYERQDDVTGKNFYRLVGGGIEFGELSDIALKREFHEELSLDIKNIKLISIFENIFTFNSKEMHEIVFLYESNFVDTSIYNKNIINGLEGDRAFKAIWISITDFSNRRYKIYPEEIISYL